MRLAGTNGLEKYQFGYLEVGFHGYLGVKGPGKRQENEPEISFRGAVIGRKGCVTGLSMM